MAFFECLVGGSGDGSTLTVTCYSGFAGLTISITNGVDTFSDVCPSTSPYEVVFDGLADGTWTISTVFGGETYTKTIEIDATTTFNPIPDGATVTPTDDIQTWLHCGDIWDKNYTTIAQVLADASALQNLIASNNAADYMERSTSWASSVCANSTAMTYIGNNDYCADKLLSNSTWRTSICNSTYFESVLNVKIPTMTSNTTPSGNCLYSTQNTGNGGYAWKAFDNNDDTVWNSLNESSPNYSYVGYNFGYNVKVYKAIIKSRLNNNAHQQLRGYDGSNWIPLTESTAMNSGNSYSSTFIIGGTINAYSSFSVYGKCDESTLANVIRTMQVYGRAAN